MAHASASSSNSTPPNKSQIAEQALRYIQVEGEVRDLQLDVRRRIRFQIAHFALDFVQQLDVPQGLLGGKMCSTN
jgi:transposase